MAAVPMAVAADCGHAGIPVAYEGSQICHSCAWDAATTEAWSRITNRHGDRYVTPRGRWTDYDRYDEFLARYRRAA